jgi:hypothetical protein
MRRILLTISCLLLLGAPPIAARTSPPPSQPSPPAQMTQARLADVDSIEHILAATYEVISGPAGADRDWARFRSLFADGARLIPVGNRKEGGVGARMLSAEDYITLATPIFRKEGFFERGIASRVERFGNIAQVFSTYESRHARGDARPFARGINSFQLMNDGKRWWVIDIMWEAESPEHPIPAEYLGR